jgi:hypothetical protein
MLALSIIAHPSTDSLSHAMAAAAHAVLESLGYGSTPLPLGPLSDEYDLRARGDPVGDYLQTTEPPLGVRGDVEVGRRNMFRRDRHAAVIVRTAIEDRRHAR